MKLKILIVVCLFSVILNGCTNQNDSKTAMNEDAESFNFILKYGYLEENILNTYDGTFTKDFITTKLELSEEERKSILDEMLIIDIFNYSEDFKKYITITPCSEYTLEINFNGRKKTLNWNGNNIPLKSIDPDAKDREKAIEYIENDETRPVLDLIRLEQKIEKIIENKSEYKKLPEPQGGYM